MIPDFSLLDINSLSPGELDILAGAGRLTIAETAARLNLTPADLNKPLKSLSDRYLILFSAFI